MVVCEDLQDGSEAETVAERIITAMSVPFDPGGQQIAVTASVGIAFSGPGGVVPEVLLRDAGFAMYQAKSTGGGRHLVIDPPALLAAGRRDDLERDLHQALQREQLSWPTSPCRRSQ